MPSLVQVAEVFVVVVFIVLLALCCRGLHAIVGHEFLGFQPCDALCALRDRDLRKDKVVQLKSTNVNINSYKLGEKTYSEMSLFLPSDMRRKVRTCSDANF